MDSTKSHWDYSYYQIGIPFYKAFPNMAGIGLQIKRLSNGLTTAKGEETNQFHLEKQLLHSGRSVLVTNR